MTGADTISGADQPCEGRRVRARAGEGFSLAGALGLSVVSSATAIFISPAVIDVDARGHHTLRGQRGAPGGLRVPELKWPGDNPVVRSPRVPRFSPTASVSRLVAGPGWSGSSAGSVSTRPRAAGMSRSAAYTGWSASCAALQGVGPSRQNRPRFVALAGDTFPIRRP